MVSGVVSSPVAIENWACLQPSWPSLACFLLGGWSFFMSVTDAYFWSPSWHSVSLLNRLTSRVGFLVPIQRCAHSTLTIWWYTAFRTGPISTKSDANSLTKIITIQIQSFEPPRFEHVETLLVLRCSWLMLRWSKKLQISDLFWG